MNHELASFVSMGLLKCIQRLEEPEIKDYVNHWKKNMRRSLSLAYQSAALFLHSFVPSLCKPLEVTFGKPEEADSKTDSISETPVKA